MKKKNPARKVVCTRRSFVRGSVAAVSASLLGSPFAMTAEVASGDAAESDLFFKPVGGQYVFDTGALRGTLRAKGQSRGLTSVVDAASGATISRGAGLFSHYRLLDAASRYGPAAWSWSSESSRLPDGAVESRWSADTDHPFDMSAVYRWAAPGVLDVTTRVVARQDLASWESFLASYFEGFSSSFVYVRGCDETGGKPGFLEAKEAYAVWQMFPRDNEAVEMIGDGRWQHLPNPVDWRIMPPLAAPLAMRRDEKTGLVGLVMAPTEDCFAVATPCSGEGHRSLYLSLFGRDLKSGESAVARSRLVIGHEITEEQALSLYAEYRKAL